MAAPQTVVDLLARASESQATGLRLLDRDGTTTWLPWPSVVARAQATAAWLLELGVRPGDAVSLVFPTGPEFFDAFFGVLLAGGVPVPLYPPVRLGRLAEYQKQTTRMLQAVDASLLLADRRAYRILGEVARDANPPLGCHVLPARPRVDGASAEGQPFGGAKSASPSDLALVQFSSGTTARPKAVALTHRAVVAQAVLLNSYWPDTGEVTHSGASWLPLYHDMGLIGCVMTALERSATLTLIPPEVFVARPASWLQAISTYGATVSPAPNFAYSLAAERVTDAELEGVDLSCWRVALCGAETVVADVVRRFQRRFAPWGLRPDAVTPVYGLSEAALAVTFSDPTRPFVSRRFDSRLLTDEATAREVTDGRELVSVGRAVPGFTIRIVDGDGRALPEGRIGEVECSGPSVMEGYLNFPDATGEVLSDGWLKTGDLGFVHEGELFLTGRRKDMLLIRGANHSPEEVESAVDGIDGVRAGCVVAVSFIPDGEDGERLLVLVEARRNAAAERYGEIAESCARSIVGATGLTAERVVVLAPGTLPRTSSGKLRRHEALTQYLAGTLAPPGAVNGLTLAGTMARSLFAHFAARRQR